eukprot:TRINITY_DN83528_c0_g1_i1.p1 TRINITY_DN83528_c0_g1~~TRINITY_DN83528_c0_g1_i1.p1  ORF type:complete len:131 (-),score=15.57 TRINITY_DN83528_c0_g1_i1:103-495(-)
MADGEHAIDGEISGAQCSICLSEFEGDEAEIKSFQEVNADTAGSTAVRLPCAGAHVYHKDCIVQWLRTKRNCPLCRSVIEPGGERARQPRANEPNDHALFDSTGRFIGTARNVSFLQSLGGAAVYTGIVC